MSQAQAQVCSHEKILPNIFFPFSACKQQEVLILSLVCQQCWCFTKCLSHSSPKKHSPVVETSPQQRPATSLVTIFHLHSLWGAAGPKMGQPGMYSPPSREQLKRFIHSKASSPSKWKTGRNRQVLCSVALSYHL